MIPHCLVIYYNSTVKISTNENLCSNYYFSNKGKEQTLEPSKSVSNLRVYLQNRLENAVFSKDKISNKNKLIVP